MVSTFASAVSELFANPWQLVGLAYILVGIGVVLYVSHLAGGTRRSKHPWHPQENAPTMLDMFFSAGALHPIVFAFQVLLWPVWIFILWASQADDDADDD